MEENKNKHYSYYAIYARGASQGLAAGMLTMAGIMACDNGWIIGGLLISLFGVLLYLETKIEI
jgi:hypothetical protein